MEKSRPWSLAAYLQESRQPRAALLFSLPLLIAYEAGVRILNHGRAEPVVNGADAILKYILLEFGLYGSLLSAGCIVLTLAVLHLRRPEVPGLGKSTTMGCMTVESLLLALPLFPIHAIVQVLMMNPTSDSVATKVVFSFGAGVYEEFVFRLLLVGGGLWLADRFIGRAGLISRNSMQLHAMAQMVCVILAALLFAAFHHWGSEGESFNLPHFAFRTLAGVYFAWIYISRGFGIAAGSHTAYDLILAVA